MSSRIGQSQAMSQYTIVPIGITRIIEDLDSLQPHMKIIYDGIIQNLLGLIIHEKYKIKKHYPMNKSR